MALVIRNVTKRYPKRKLGLDNFSLTINKGILGLLGPNGAGKSTLMKIIASVSRPSEGSLALDGVDLVKDPNHIRKILGYLPQDFGVYPNLNAYEFLEYIAAMKGVGGKNLRTRIDYILDRVNLTESASRPIGTYSGGMKQRIGIAQAILNDPKVLIFDEPTVGLDPEERVRFRHLISELAIDCVVILSSHIVSDIETIADEVAIMKNGILISKGIQPDIVSQVQGKVFHVNMPEESLATFKAGHLVIDTVRQKSAVKVRYIHLENDLPVGSMPVDATLEDAYLYLTKK